MLEDNQIMWLLQSDEPWTRLRTRIDLLGQDEDGPAVSAEREAMLADARIEELIATAVSWPGYALKRHNDARHPLYAISTLADFGLNRAHPAIQQLAENIMGRQDEGGAFLTRLRLYRQFGGLDGEYDAWMLCDWPTLLYALIAFGCSADPRVRDSVEHLRLLCQESGWSCGASPMLGTFKGPGRRDAPCPMANVYALKALSMLPAYVDSPESRAGCETLLAHWDEFARARAARETEAAFNPRKLYLFGVGSDFRKLKYPFVWYDLLHVADVLSRFPFTRDDPRLAQMVAAILQQADENGRFRAGSMYRAWSGWSFADKKRPSPWLTFLVWRIRQRVGEKPIL